MSGRDVRLYLHDILESGNAILDYVEGLTYKDFTVDRKTWAARVREFEVIGEAVGRLPDHVKEHPGVERRDIKDFRNLLAHEYFGIDLEIVWKIVQQDLPRLLDAVGKILEDLK